MGPQGEKSKERGALWSSLIIENANAPVDLPLFE